MRPRLKPALRPAWRGPDQLQLGLEPSVAVALAGVGPRTSRLLAALDGTRDASGLLRAAAELGFDEPTAQRLLDTLTAAGAVEDAALDGLALDGLGPAERARLGPELAALGLRHRAAGVAQRLLAGRRRRAVTVVGASRVGSVLAALLAASGVGTVALRDPDPAGAADALPGGLTAGDAGRARDVAGVDLLHRVAPEVSVTPTRRPDLLLLAPPEGLVTGHEGLLRSGVPHLLATVRDGIGTVGPLVIPGRTPCLRCVDLHRTDRDRAWPLLLAQLAPAGTPPRAGPTDASDMPEHGAATATACDSVLATAVAAHAAWQALAFLDGAMAAGDPLATVAGSLRIEWPGGVVRRRSWRPHPACGCQWAALAAATPDDQAPDDQAPDDQAPDDQAPEAEAAVAS